MLGNEGDQQEKDCYHGDEDALRDPRSDETIPGRDHMRNEEIRRILHISPIDEVMRCGRLRWFGHVQRRDADNVTRRVMNLAIPYRYQTTRKPQEDVAPTIEGRHDGRGCDPGCGPRPDGVETEDKADPYEIGKRPLKVSMTPHCT